MEVLRWALDEVAETDAPPEVRHIAARTQLHVRVHEQPAVRMHAVWPEPALGITHS